MKGNTCGPSSAANRPVPGTVVATSATGRRCTVPVGPSGTFTMHLAPGTYTFTGTSPNYLGGKGTCRAATAVTVANRPIKSQGPNAGADVVCPIR